MIDHEDKVIYNPEEETCRNTNCDIAPNILGEEEQENKKLREGGY